MNSITSNLFRILLQSPVHPVILKFVGLYELVTWDFRGRNIPIPRSIKHKHVSSIANKFNLEIFVETGTYLGETVDATKSIFKRVHTIEIDRYLFERAKKKFGSYGHISVYKGDSAKILPRILTKLDLPTLFWLDAHDSKGISGMSDVVTPVEAELTKILLSKIKKYAILIDDADAFLGRKGYPTLKKVKEEIREKKPTFSVSVRDNIIFIVPKTS